MNFIHEKGGRVSRQELLANLVRGGRGLSKSTNVVQMLSNYNLVRKQDNTDRSSVLILEDWVATLSNGFKSKGDVMLTLFAGIVSGGRGASDKTKNSLEAEPNSGTRLIISGLTTLRKRGKNSPSLTDLSTEIQERQMTALYLICGLMDIPSEGDPYSLGLLHMIGRMGKHESTTVTLDPSVFHSYQTCAMNRFLCAIIPRVILEKTGMTFAQAQERKLTQLSADSIRESLATHRLPAVWTTESERDDLIEEVTKGWGFDWWAEDRRGGGRGLKGDQMKVYVNVVSQPLPGDLRTPYTLR